MKDEGFLEKLLSTVRQNNLRLNNIEKLLQARNEYNQENNQPVWFNLDEVINYDPVGRTKPTWYSMVSRGQVPYHKSGNRLMFLKSEIDEWLKSGKHKTKSEIKDEVHSYLVNNKRKGY